jgi:hypothetical protein
VLAFPGHVIERVQNQVGPAFAAAVAGEQRAIEAYGFGGGQHHRLLTVVVL